jgi:hypothetical protein
MQSDKVLCTYPFLLAILMLGLLSAGVFAQGGAGLRGGVSIDPEQAFIGAHFDAGPLVDRLWFRPNLELGFGDNRTTVALNGEFAYWLALADTDWRLYAGAGPSIIIYRFDSDFRPRMADRTRARGGLNFLVGMGHPGGFFGELKVGAIDSPRVKLTVGYTFR